MKRNNAISSLIILLGLLAVAGCSEAGGQELVNGKLGREVQGIIASKKLQGATIGVKIYSITDKETVYELDANTARSVASNMKLATTAAALAKLGKDYELKAVLYRRGEIVSGVLKGDLVIVGRGDPNISGRFYSADAETVLDSWADVLRSVGIDCVEGSIIADGTAYGAETIPPGWPQNQLERWYCAPVSPLAINDNCFDVTVAPGAAAGQPAIVSVRPRAGIVKLTNQCTTTSSKGKHLISVLRLPGTNDVTVKGQFWSGANPQTFPITVHDPVAVFASAFDEALQREGIRHQGGTEVARNPVDTRGLIPVAQHATLLSTAIAVTNKRSQNLHAEMLLRELGRLSGSGTRQDGIKAIVQFFATFDVPAAQVSPADGCGLDSDSKLSPSALVALLVYMRSNPEFRVFKESLAVSGYDGTLENRLDDKEQAGKVHAKTGYIRGVSSLSGYAVNKSGKEFAFSIIFNNAAKLSNTFMKSVQDEIVAALVKSQ
jgi:D-alanyl-D-alanine carboxypeptidase/D-alanyl-D-alanine-endopeptidase (penicillin-binding protein 4)